MLKLKFSARDLYNNKTDEFIYLPERSLRFEHSLAALSKWEEKYEKAYLEMKERTIEEDLYYVWCMCLDDIDYEELILYLTNDIMSQLSEYISARHSATHVPSIGKTTGPKDKMTTEMIYYMMTIWHIPFEADQWNFNRLMSLIEICSFKANPPKKRSTAELIEERRKINEQRKREWGTRG